MHAQTPCESHHNGVWCEVENLSSFEIWEQNRTREQGPALPRLHDPHRLLGGRCGVCEVADTRTAQAHASSDKGDCQGRRCRRNAGYYVNYYRV